jgi:hypothetical protein
MESRERLLVLAERGVGLTEGSQGALLSGAVPLASVEAGRLGPPADGVREGPALERAEASPELLVRGSVRRPGRGAEDQQEQEEQRRASCHERYLSRTGRNEMAGLWAFGGGLASFLDLRQRPSVRA